MTRHYQLISTDQLHTIAVAHDWRLQRSVWSDEGIASDPATAVMIAQARRPYDLTVEYRSGDDLLTVLFDEQGTELTYWVYRHSDELGVREPISLALHFEYFPEGHTGLYLNKRWLLGSLIEHIIN